MLTTEKKLTEPPQTENLRSLIEGHVEVCDDPDFDSSLARPSHGGSQIAGRQHVQAQIHADPSSVEDVDDPLQIVLTAMPVGTILVSVAPTAAIVEGYQPVDMARPQRAADHLPQNETHQFYSH